MTGVAPESDGATVRQKKPSSMRVGPNTVSENFDRGYTHPSRSAARLRLYTPTPGLNSGPALFGISCRKESRGRI